MAFQPVPETAQIIVRHEGVSQLIGALAEWSVYTRLPTGFAQSDIDDLSDAMTTWLTDEYVDILSEDWQVSELVVKTLSTEGGPFKTTQPDLSGLLAGDPMPANNALYIRFYGTGGGSPLSGGVFWPVGNEANCDGNNWLAAFRVTVQAKLDLLLANVLDGLFLGQTHVIVSRYASTNDDIKDARAALRAAIAASRRAEGVTNTVASNALRAPVASQRDRRGQI